MDKIVVFGLTAAILILSVAEFVPPALRLLLYVLFLVGAAYATVTWGHAVF